jgi:hypothetical protein
LTRRKATIMPDLPIACRLQPDELKQRADDLLPGLADAATTCAPIEGGYRFEFASCTETLSTLLRVIDAERQCCRFLRFQLTVEPDGGLFRLDVTGASGTQEFLRSLTNRRRDVPSAADAPDR